MDFSRLKIETRPFEMRRKSFRHNFEKNIQFSEADTKDSLKMRQKKEISAQNEKNNILISKRGCAALDRWSKYTTNGIT